MPTSNLNETQTGEANDLGHPLNFFFRPDKLCMRMLFASKSGIKFKFDTSGVNDGDYHTGKYWIFCYAFNFRHVVNEWEELRISWFKKFQEGAQTW